MIAYCGLNCFECKAYIATKNKDDLLRAEVAQEWSEIYKIEIKACNIECDGCKSNSSSLFFHCSNCEIRKCAINFKFEHCGKCKNYPCKKLKLIHDNDESAKINIKNAS